MHHLPDKNRREMSCGGFGCALDEAKSDWTCTSSRGREWRRPSAGRATAVRQHVADEASLCSVPIELTAGLVCGAPSLPSFLGLSASPGNRVATSGDGAEPVRPSVEVLDFTSMAIVTRSHEPQSVETDLQR